jgi:uncharacterized membrane protein YebE (DUF533 family)
MNLQSILNQVLQSAAGTQRSDAGKYVTGGVIGLLLGSRRGRSMGGTALKYGSVAALGAMAWKAYQDHQAKQLAPPSAGAGAAPSSAPTAMPTSTPFGAAPAQPPSFAALPAPQAELHSMAMLKAMIAAAKSDGHVDEREQALMRAELDRSGADAEARAWVEAEMKRPVDAADVAAAATTPEMAAEVYLATLVVVDDTTVMERAYLDELARRLNLAPALKADLEARAKAMA